jgi:hypothetical protein
MKLCKTRHLIALQQKAPLFGETFQLYIYNPSHFSIELFNS